MRGSSDHNNRSDGEDQEILKIGRPRYHNERLEHEQLVEEEEEEMAVEQLNEKEQIRIYESDQSDLVSPWCTVNSIKGSGM